jgi:hypothetical protein
VEEDLKDIEQKVEEAKKGRRLEELKKIPTGNGNGNGNGHLNGTKKGGAAGLGRIGAGGGHGNGGFFAKSGAAAGGGGGATRTL